MNKDNPNEHQEGGDHYKTGTVEHWDFVELNGVGYLEGCATKYVARNRTKHKSPVGDLRKALHYVMKLHNLAARGVRFNRRMSVNQYGQQVLRTTTIPVTAFAEAYSLNPVETQICSLLFNWSGVADLEKAEHLIEFLIQEALEKPEATV